MQNFGTLRQPLLSELAMSPEEIQKFLLFLLLPRTELLTGTTEIGHVSKGSPRPTNPKVVRTLRRRNFVNSFIIEAGPAFTVELLSSAGSLGKISGPDNNC